MKKNRPRQPARPPKPHPGKTKGDGEGKSFNRTQLLFWLAVAVLLLYAVGSRIYKAHHAGITYDECMSFRMFAEDLHTALTNYTHPNNHVLNTVGIYFAQQWFRSYEHFIRIPSLLAGICFAVVMMVIVNQTIRSRPLRLAAYALATLTPMVYDYSWLARGNALAFAALYTQIAIVLWLMDRKMRFSRWIVPVLILGLLNFLAFGAMIACALSLSAFNVAFIFIFCRNIYRNPPPRWKCTLAHLLPNLIITLGLSAFLLYRLWPKLSRVAQKKVSEKYLNFSDYLYTLLFERVFYPLDALGVIFMILFGALVLVCAGYFLWRLTQHVRQKQWRQILYGDEKAAFIITIAVLTLLFIFIYNVILKRLLAHPRYMVYLVPVFFLACVILFDRFIIRLGPRPAARLVHIFAVALLAATIIHRWPSPHFILNSNMGISGPVLRQLHEIDPRRTWQIGFSDDMRNHYYSFSYYAVLDLYPWNMARSSEQMDVFVLRIEEMDDFPGIENGYFLMPDYLRQVNTAVFWSNPLPIEPEKYRLRHWPG